MSPSKAAQVLRQHLDWRLGNIPHPPLASSVIKAMAVVVDNMDALLKDKARLDWLEKMAAENRQWTLIVAYGFDANYDDTVMFCDREGIDKAMEVER